MTEEPIEEVAIEAEAPKKAKKEKKKGGKLPVIIALVIMLGGGGFFAMKMKGGAAKETVALGEIADLEEFLVNLQTPNAYARANISLQLEKGFKKEEFEAKMPAVRDAIVLKLSSKNLEAVKTLEGKLQLKREIAEVVNAVLAEHPKEADQPKSAKTSNAKAGGKDEQGPQAKPAHPDWDSQTGPVLKVFFTSFATQ